MGTIKINNKSISKLYLGNIAVKRAYSNGSIVYDTGVQPTPKPCFEVVDTITNASGKYVDVYAKDTQKWYKKNNLNQYEEYCIVDEVADLSTLTYYTGKLINVGYFKQMRDLLPIFGLSLFMWLSVHCAIYFIPNMLLQIFVGGCLGFIIYIGGALLFRFDELKDVKYLLQRKS